MRAPILLPFLLCGALGLVQRPPRSFRPRTLLSADPHAEEEPLLSVEPHAEEEPPLSAEEEPPALKKNAAWLSLSESAKRGLIQDGVSKAIRNKSRRESKVDKRKRMESFVKKSREGKKWAARVRRPVSFEGRAPLGELEVGSERNGTVISVTNFGAYVDVGTECDGLVHVSQLTRKMFVEHPRQVVTPGDAVVVRVTRLDPEGKKIQLSMLDLEELEEEEEGERISLEDIEVDDELWGELKRVTDFGAYVDLGAEVDGFLHFMDHPDFGAVQGVHPSEYMEKGQRVRTWASDVDKERKRIKLTANRPSTIPMLKRDFR